MKWLQAYLARLVRNDLLSGGLSGPEGVNDLVVWDDDTILYDPSNGDGVAVALVECDPYDEESLPTPGLVIQKGGQGNKKQGEETMRQTISNTPGYKVITANSVFNVLDANNDISQMSLEGVFNAVQGGLDLADVVLYVDGYDARHEQRHREQAKKIGDMCVNLDDEQLQRALEFVANLQIRDPIGAGEPS